jgi:ABC-2 type transport system ATP-binding protein
MSAVIEIENLTKDYQVGFLRKKKVRALDGLSITVNRGEVFGFLGANGAGKTTTLKLLMRLIYPTAGKATILGHGIDDISMHRYIGYLPENPYFYDYLTAREFINYCGRLFGMNSVDQKSATERLLTRVDLDSKSWDKQLRKFSKGMLQRVGLAQALVNDPEVVFLDEPMSGLDPLGRKQVRDLILELKSAGKTIFMCSHILSDIEVLCDRVTVMRKGRVSATGRLDELLVKTGADQAFEIMVSGLNAAQMQTRLNSTSSILPSPSGVRITVPSEEHINDVLQSVRALGGKLVSVTSARQSLEDLFISDGEM